MIEVSGLSKRYGDLQVLDRVSFRVGAGEAVALWGQNGAGKTTTLKCLLGVIQYAGDIRVDGRDTRRFPRQTRARIGYVPQELSFYDLPAVDVVEFFARLKKVDPAGAATSLGRVGLADAARRPVGALSGGMKQRLAVALALLGDPPVLLLDEPAASLDAGARRELVEMLVDLKCAGQTILFASHRPEEVAQVADRVVVLERGRVLRECPPLELWHRPARLRVRLDGEGRLDEGVAALAAAGYTASRNSHTLLVQVEPGRKAAPLGALERAGVSVADFELEGDPWMQPS